MQEIAFVSMPFGEKIDSLENEWTRLYQFGLKPLETDFPETAGAKGLLPIRLTRADKDQQSLGHRHARGLSFGE